MRSKTGTPPARVFMALAASIAVLAYRLPALAAPSAAGRIHTDPRYAFELAVPPQLTEQHNADSPAALMLQNSEGGYPTFNIIVSASTGKMEPRSLSEKGVRVLEDYRKVGLVDAVLVSQTEEQIGGMNADSFLLSYHSSGNAYRAQVTILTTRRFQYLMTYIDKAEHFEETRDSREALIRSFRSFDEPANEAAQSGSKSLLYFLAAGALLCLTFLSARAFRSLRRTMPN